MPEKPETHGAFSDLLADADAFAPPDILTDAFTTADYAAVCRNNQIRFEHPYLGDRESLLLCPRCGGNYLHHTAIEVFERDESDEKGMHTIVTRDHVDLKYDSLFDNPSPYRHGFLVKFDCEFCGNSLTMKLYQHKGQTFMGWDLDRLRNQSDVEDELISLMERGYVELDSTGQKWRFTELGRTALMGDSAAEPPQQERE